MVPRTFTSTSRRIDVGWCVVERAVEADAGVADHHVEAAERLDRARDELLHVSVDRDVAWHRERVSARTRQLPHEIVQPVLTPGRQHHRRAIPRERSAHARPIPVTRR